MFLCHICRKVFFIKNGLISHLKQHSLSGDTVFPLKCVQPNCNYLNHIYDFKSLNRHLLSFHKDQEFDLEFNKNEPIYQSSQSYKNPVFLNDEIQNGPEFIDNSKINQNKNNFFENIQNNILKSIILFKSKPNITESFVKLLIDEFSNILEELLNSIIILIKSFFTEKNNQEKLSELLDEIKNFKTLFESVNSTHKIQNHIKNLNKFVKSEEIMFGYRNDTKMVEGICQIVQKKESFQYISITETLHLILKKQSIRNSIRNFDIHHEFEPIFFSNSSFWNKTNNLKLLLYYDEIEVKNPLGEIAGVYKLAVFYFTVMNLTRKNNSNLKNIFLVASAFSEDVKKYGINRILNRISSEVKQLEINGISIDGEIYRASIFQVSADNLGLHQLFNLKCCFIGENICHLCNASTKIIQSDFSETCFNKTTKASYEQKLNLVLKDKMNSKNYGINDICALNELSFFHTTRNYAFDLTHDLWEGIVPIELSLILNQFINKDKYFDLYFLNQRIILYNYGRVDSKNKPSPLKVDNHGVKIKQKAAKISCLFRHFSFLIGDKIPQNNKYWQLYLYLSKIVEICYTTDLSFGLIVQLEWLVEEHHVLFKELFPNENLKKKHHNLVHYGTAMKHIGSLVDYSTIRFEAKHSFIKTAVRTTNNCKNILLSLNKKYQHNFCYNLINYNLTKNEYEHDIIEELQIENIADSKLKESVMKLTNSKSVMVLKSLKIFGQNFKKNMFVIANMKDEKKIIKITQLLQIDECYMAYGDIFEIQYFDEHYHAFVVNSKDESELLSLNQLYDFQPFDLIKNLDQTDNRLFVKTCLSL